MHNDELEQITRASPRMRNNSAGSRGLIQKVERNQVIVKSLVPVIL